MQAGEWIFHKIRLPKRYKSRPLSILTLGYLCPCGGFYKKRVDLCTGKSERSTFSEGC